MTPLLLAAAEEREASPIALVVILFLTVALVLLIRSMNRHLRKVPARFPVDQEPAAGPADQGRADRGRADPGRADPGRAERRADEPGDEA